MHAAHTVILICTASALAIAAKAETRKLAASGKDNIEIAAVSDDPAEESGLLATAVEISGVSGGEGTTTYYIPYMVSGQAKPKVGQKCKVDWRWHEAFDWITVKGSVRGVRLVKDFDCGSGSSGNF